MDEAEKQRQPACKPGSVWPGLAPRRDGHSSGTPVAGRLEQPTRATRPTDKARGQTARRSYSVLLPAGLAVPPTLPPARCALTAPFHPYPDGPCSLASGRFAFCGAIPGVAPAGRYPAPRPYGARTFLRFPRKAAAVRPTGATGHMSDRRGRSREKARRASMNRRRSLAYSAIRRAGMILAMHSTVVSERLAPVRATRCLSGAA